MDNIKLTATQASYMSIPMNTKVSKISSDSSESDLISLAKKNILDIEAHPYWKTLEIPSQFDGRAVWKLVSPQDQNQCGSCWAYAAVTALTDRFNIIGDMDIMLSVAQTVLCDWKGMDAFLFRQDQDKSVRLEQVRSINQKLLKEAACFGNSLYLVWNYLFTEGTVLESCIPKKYLNETDMTDQQALCAHVSGKSFDMCADFRIDSKQETGTPARFYRCRSFYFVPGVSDVNGSEIMIRREIYKYGPVTTAFDVYKDFYLLKPGDIYRRNPMAPYTGGHAVVIVGWGDKNGINYWIVRNSWGRNWCDGGYCLIERGVNMCNIEHNVFAGLPDFYTGDEDIPYDIPSKNVRYWFTSIEAPGGGIEPEFGYSRRILHTRILGDVLKLADIQPLLPESPYSKDIVVGKVLSSKTNTVQSDPTQYNTHSWYDIPIVWIVLYMVFLFLILFFYFRFLNRINE